VQLVATPGFREAYERLDQATLGTVNEAILRLAEDPSSVWARQNRVLGKQGTAWLIIIRCRTRDCALYWNQPDPTGPVQLLLLLAR
jgi:hypothetical protein